MSSIERCSRRTLLKTAAGAAAGAVAAPFIVSSSALGNAGHVAASNRITLGFIGIGGRGGGLLEEMARRTDVEILALCDVQQSQRERAAITMELTRSDRAAAGGYRAFTQHRDFREVLARDDIDAVVISAPEHWRPIMCVMAAEAGKDVYTEKPFALTIREGQAIVEAMRRNGRIFQHGTQRRSNNASGLRDSCEMIRSGRIGKPTHAVVTVGPGPLADATDFARSLPPPDPDHFDWEMWLGPAAWRPWPGEPLRWEPLRPEPMPDTKLAKIPHAGSFGWQGIRDFGLRSIGNWGAHVLDMAQWALGRDAEGPVEILPPDGPIPLTLRYADGVSIQCPRTAGDSHLCTVFGTEGHKLVFGWHRIGQTFSADLVKPEKYDRRPIGPNDVRLTRSENDDHTGNWLHGIRTRTPTICNEEVAYRSGSLCCLIAIMDRLQRPLKYDPVRGEFPGDAEANALLGTPKRAPWRI